MTPFIVYYPDEPNVKIHVTWDWKKRFRGTKQYMGSDNLLLYYRDTQYYYCELNGGDKGSVSQTKYTDDFSYMNCVINTVDFDVPQNKLHQILRMIPMRQILLHQNVLFLHASQILYKNKGIVFSAPSGTGKTTQAKLWRENRNAEIICNDRTLLRHVNGNWWTYGYPYDGSEPIASNKRNVLACIILLEKGKENSILRLSSAKAIASLMQQTVIDGWDCTSRQKALDLIITVFEKVPIYLFKCTACENAVVVLEKTLREEGIIDGKST